MIVYDEDGLTLHQADVLDGLAALADGSVQTCVTSPPYWGLRDYGTAEWIGGDAACEHKRPVAARTARPAGLLTGSKEYVAQQEMSGPACPCGATRQDSGIGLEPTPELYVERMVAVFREVRRVLRDDGTLWLNLGDTYSSGGHVEMQVLDTMRDAASGKQANLNGTAVRAPTPPDMKPKDLIGIPWLVAFALQRDGWYLRSDIIWSKPNPMPESVRDRPTKAHEYIFLLSKSQRYFFDQDAVREGYATGIDNPDDYKARIGDKPHAQIGIAGQDGRRALNLTNAAFNPSGRNIRTVWTIATQPSPLPHFAAFPEELAVRCIKAGSKPSDVVLDPFCGTGTTLKVARDLGRKAIGIELSEKYCELAVTRLRYGTKGAVAVSKGQESLWGGQVEMLDSDKQSALGKRTYDGFNERWKNR